MSEGSDRQGDRQAETPAQVERDRETGCRFEILKDRSLLTSLAEQIRGWINFRQTSTHAAQSSTRLPVTDMAPWYRDLPDQIAELFQKRPRGLARAAGAQAGDREIFRDFKQEPASWGNSVLVHVVVLTALAIPYLKSVAPATHISQPGHDRTILYLPPASLLGLDRDPHGGGGSGNHSLTLPSKGAIPRFSNQPIVPVLVQASQVLPVPPTLAGDPNLRLPEMKLNMNWGDPTGVPGDLSGGPGSGDSFGTGKGDGIGPGHGDGYGPGKDKGFGNYGFQPGTGGVSEPVPIYKPEPPYTEEARKTKLQGVVDLMIVINPDGNVAFARVIKPLGMGLDESARETVKTWRFKPALRNGSPVPVRVMVQVSFRLF